MAGEFNWGMGSGDKKAVVMTEEHAKALITRIVEEVAKVRDGETLEQFKQFARQEVDLSSVREQLARKDQEIASLRAHIGTLNGFLAAMAPVNGSSYSIPSVPNTQAFALSSDQ